MKRVYAIDIPMLTDTDVFNASVLLDSLQAMKDHNCCLLMMDEETWYSLITADSNTDYEVVDRVIEKLSYLEAKYYDESVYSQYISYQPDMRDVSYTPDLNKAISHQMCALHVDDDGQNVLFLLREARWPNGAQTLDTIRDHRSKSHNVLLVDKESLAKWLQSRKPEYIDGRHRVEEHGEVSSFKAGGNPAYAKDLLLQAYGDTESDEEYPQYLYTYDKENGCFVQFRYDRNKQYHGMDIKDTDERIPPKLHDKYHK